MSREILPVNLIRRRGLGGESDHNRSNRDMVKTSESEFVSHSLPRIRRIGKPVVGLPASLRKKISKCFPDKSQRYVWELSERVTFGMEDGNQHDEHPFRHFSSGLALRSAEPGAESGLHDRGDADARPGHWGQHHHF